MKHLLVVLFAASALCSPVARADDAAPPPASATAAVSAAPVTECDTLSGMPPEQGYVTYDEDGIRYKHGGTDAEIATVVAACRAAAARYPEEARFPFRVGLALRDRGDVAEAMAAFTAASKLGSLGGYDEAAMLLFFGDRVDPASFAKDGKAGLALLDEGLAKSNNAPILLVSKALGLIAGPEDIRDVDAGIAILRGLAEKNDVLGTVILADFLGRPGQNSAPDKEEVLALYRKAVELGSGTAAERLGDHMMTDDPPVAVKMLELGAERGNTHAMDYLGLLYETGTNVTRDVGKARDFYERAALKGYTAAQLNLGVLYLVGAGGPADPAKAVHWLELASARGNAKAMFQLGMMYDHGRGVPKDWAKARSLYEQGAARGEPRAMNNMGYLFERGRAAPVDFAKAKEWYEKAIEKGSGTAAANLAGMYQHGRGVTKDMAKALELLRKSVAAKSPDGANNLALAYQEGRGVEPDPEKARALFSQAIEYGSTEAKHNLANLLEKGLGGDRDWDQARELFKQAAESGVPNAMYRYAMRLYYDKAGGDYDSRFGFYLLHYTYRKAKDKGEEAVFDEIRSWLSKAVAAGDDYGLELLAQMVADGIGGAKDPVEARRLFQQVAVKPPHMKLDMARRLRFGQGMAADPAEARRLYGELAQSDEAKVALEALAQMMDRGEGGPKDPALATALIQERADSGNMVAYRLLAQRTAQGIGIRRDPAAARMLFSVAVAGDDREAHGLLGLMYERGEGGPANLKAAIALYRIGLSRQDKLSAARLALLLRQGRGMPADPVEARRIFDDQYRFEDREAEMACFEMLDRGEGGPKDPAKAARTLISAAFSNRNPAAIALLRNPDGKMSAITRAVIIDRLIEMKIEPANETAGPLIGKDVEAKLKVAKAGR